MAYMLTIALIQYVTGGNEDGSMWSILVTFLLQFSVGGLLGYAMGWLTVKLLNKANIGRRPSLRCIFLERRSAKTEAESVLDIVAASSSAIGKVKCTGASPS